MFVLGISAVASAVEAKVQQTFGQSADVGKWVGRVLSQQEAHCVRGQNTYCNSNWMFLSQRATLL